jgi:hypothetical protein
VINPAGVFGPGENYDSSNTDDAGLYTGGGA